MDHYGAYKHTLAWGIFFRSEPFRYTLDQRTYIYLAPSIRFLVRGGLNSVMSYARLRPRAYNLALRLRPGTKKLIEGAK